MFIHKINITIDNQFRLRTNICINTTVISVTLRTIACNLETITKKRHSFTFVLYMHKSANKRRPKTEKVCAFT